MRQSGSWAATLATLATAAIALTLSGCGSSGAQGEASSPAALTTLEPGVLKACLYAGFAPFASKSGDAWVGWDVDYLKAFAEDRGLTLQPVEAPSFNDIWMRPGRGECDVAGTGITMVPARSAQAGNSTAWTSPYYSVARSFAVRSGTKLTDIHDLAGKTVIVTRGSTADIDLTSRLAKAGITDTTVEYTDNEASGAERVATGNTGGAFAYGGGAGSVQQLTKQIPGLELAWEHCLMLPDGTISSEPFGFAVRKASTGVLEALDAFITDSTNAYPGGSGSGRNCPNDAG
jgi:polar amino acid transport system substrate-binding protein